MAVISTYIGLGSNLGDSRRYLDVALQALRALAVDGELRRSRLYRSEPMGPSGQSDYLNAVAWLATEYSATGLLQALQRIELSCGRRRSVRWGARTLDLDLLIHGESVIDKPDLQVPHPGIAQRLFVLAPLSDLQPDLVVPGVGAVEELRRCCPPMRIQVLPWQE